MIFKSAHPFRAQSTKGFSADSQLSALDRFHGVLSL